LWFKILALVTPFVLSEEKLMEYFPEDMSDEEIENIIIELLQKWKGEDANG